MIETKAFRTFIGIYSLFKSERLNTIKLTLHKALIRSVMTYVCPAHRHNRNYLTVREIWTWAPEGTGLTGRQTFGRNAALTLRDPPLIVW
jgi:hypothetical protein